MKAPILARTIGIFIFLYCSQTLYAQERLELPSFKILDTDRDGRMSHAEFYSGMDSALLFESWDSNQDGRLDRQELYNIIQAGSTQAAAAVMLEASYAGRMSTTGHTARQEREAGELQLLSNFFRLADLNRDNLLYKAEFYLFIFRQYDADENGSLSLREYTTGSL